MTNVCSFNRQVDNTFYRYIIYCAKGIGDMKMALINTNHKTECHSYSYSTYREDEVHQLLRDLYYGPKKDMFIVEHKQELHHYMEDAPEWVMRHPSGYYYSPVQSTLIYVGDDFYE